MQSAYRVLEVGLGLREVRGSFASRDSLLPVALLGTIHSNLGKSQHLIFAVATEILRPIRPVDSNESLATIPM